MIRRIWSACCAFLLAAFVVAAVALASTSPCFADETDDAPGIERVRVQLDDPETKQPGDDDQPTIAPRRGAMLDPASPTLSDATAQPANGGAAKPAAPAQPAGLQAWIEMMRAFMARIVFVLR
jgi:hypothetical protein